MRGVVVVADEHVDSRLEEARGEARSGVTESTTAAARPAPSPAARAFDAQPAAERIDAIGDAHQPVALGIRPADSVVAHLEGEDAVLDRRSSPSPASPERA